VKDVAETRYEMLRVGDLVEYSDPIPEATMYIQAPGLVMAIPGLNYVQVMWLDKDLKPGVFLRRELRILSRVTGEAAVENSPKKYCKR
jgi:hypothetical protein